ncbi:MAG: hypothetical protein ACI4EY_02985 [Lachnospiraceae bacterium]
MKKSLLDIQQEIREVDSKVRNISASIAEIYDEIDDLRNDDSDTIDYEMIRLLSLHLKFGKHPLDGLEDAYACQIYIEMLLSLVQADRGSEQTINRLIFIQWILTQSRLDITLEELFKESFKITPDTFGELAEVVPKTYRKQFVVDALITANICGPANDGVLVYVVNLCSILGIEKEQMRILSIIAKGILQQNLGKMKKVDLQQVLAQAKNFKHYLNNDILNAGLCSQRMIAVEAPDKTHINFRWKVKQQGAVEKGDVIATYGYGSRWLGSSLTEITAPCAGTLFQFRNNCINYGVISHESDNKDSIKSWTLQRR